ncbi:MAG TPA: histidine kinase [Longimicrobiaceae bacterium]|nr:histidine kinase [Longimicrobiaceae bacterium]
MHIVHETPAASLPLTAPDAGPGSSPAERDPGGVGTAGEAAPQPIRLRWGPIIGFWAAFWMFFTALRLLDVFWLDPGSYSSSRMYGILDYAVQYGLLALVTPAIFWLSGRLPVTRRNWRRRVPLHVGIGLVVVLAIMLLMFALHNQYAHPPGERHRWTLLEVGQEMIAYGYHFHLLVYLGILTAGFALHYYNALQRQQLAAVQMAAQLSEARLQSLRMQLHPHFLFNTLNTISMLTERDPAGARRVIARLGELLRRALESTREQEIPLAEELRFADGYLEIVTARFGDRLHIDKRIDPAACDALVPTLILQPLLENAVEHGIARINSLGWIEIAVLREGGVLRLEVRDNGPGAREQDIAEGVGLRNTRARLEQLYGAAGILALRGGEGGGFVAEATLPFHTPADLRIPLVYGTSAAGAG